MKFAPPPAPSPASLPLAVARRASKLALASALGLAALLTSGCPSREFYRVEPEAPYAASGIRQLEVPAFEASPNAWPVADAARLALCRELARGTIELVDKNGQGVLHGAIAQYTETTTPSAPRRVAVNGGTSVVSASSYRWDMDVTHGVQLRLVLRLVGADGRPLWSKDAYGSASETSSVTLNWPGSDPVTPPAVLPAPVDPSVYQRLREQALDEALAPLIGALTLHYGYKELK